MTYNVFGGTLNLAQPQPVIYCTGTDNQKCSQATIESIHKEHRRTKIVF